MNGKRLILGDIYFSEDAGELCFGNSQVELRFSKYSGSWIGLTSRAGDTEIFRQEGEVPTELITVDGESKRINRQPYYVVVNAATLGYDPRYIHHSLRSINNEMVKLTICSKDETGEWRLYSSYIIRTRESTFERSLRIAYVGEGTRLLRDIRFIVPGIGIGKPRDCLFEAPGCSIKPHYPVSALPENKRLVFGIAPHQRPGLLAVHNPAERCALMCWPHSKAEPFIPSIKKSRGIITFIQQMLVADCFRKGHVLTCGSQFIRIHLGSWRSALRCFQRWCNAVGLTVPKDTPMWAKSAKIYELVVCDPDKLPSNLRGVCPFLSFEAVIEELPHIRELGFDIIQIIPYHPYPGYAVEDYYSIDKTYGSKGEVKRMIKRAHDFGMKVILDLVIHGCVDKSIIKVWRHSQKSGIILEDRDQEEETLWFGGSPIPHINPIPAPFKPGGERYIEWLGESPILKHHPEWFMRTEDGEIASTHTFAFDHANEGWQRYIIDVMKFYLQELDVDGFRIDWPDWNFFPNWDSNISYHASNSFGGAVRMLEKARRELKTIKSGIIFYVECPGPFYHKVADFTYNYDEHWLFAALASLTSEHITAREAAEWFEERKIVFPEGSIKAHHVYSSNTHFWWLRSKKMGRPVYRALFALCSFIEGALMNYAGGEKGSEDFFKKVLKIRDEIPALSHGDCEYTAISCSCDMIFAVLRSFKGNHAVPVISFNPSTSRFTLTLPIREMGIQLRSSYVIYDALNNRMLKGTNGKTIFSGEELSKIEMEMAPYAVAVLLIKETTSNY